jgi:peptidoglycan/xylan/chitin deacetylase (PgdA/CDA1 family)
VCAVSRRLLVLGWHNVAATPGFPAPEGASERGFERQMTALARVANVLPLEDALRRLYRGERLPARAVAVTFDDGYRDNVTLAVPVLERLGLPATFFLVPGLLSGTIDAWWETLGWALASTGEPAVSLDGVRMALSSEAERGAAYSHLARWLRRVDQRRRETAMVELVESLSPRGEPPQLFMGWDEARELVRRGFSVQSHTCTHPALAREPAERQRAELVQARAELESTLELSISTVAYPYGGPAEYDAQTAALAGECGYEWGITTREGFTTPGTPPLEVRRCVVYPERGIVDLLAQLRYVASSWLSGTPA